MNKAEQVAQVIRGSVEEEEKKDTRERRQERRKKVEWTEKRRQ